MDKSKAEELLQSSWTEVANWFNTHGHEDSPNLVVAHLQVLTAVMVDLVRAARPEGSKEG